MGHVLTRLQKTLKGTGKSKKGENPRRQYHPVGNQSKAITSEVTKLRSSISYFVYSNKSQR